MPKITALLRTRNDALRLGRALDSLRSCDEVLVVDANSEDDTERIAREHGTVFKSAIPGVTGAAYAIDAANDWILCLHPNESLSDDLEAALLEWKQEEPPETAACYSVRVSRENAGGWQKGPPEVRLVNRKRISWVGEMPPAQLRCEVLNGDVLCFNEP